MINPLDGWDNLQYRTCKCFICLQNNYITWLVFNSIVNSWHTKRSTLTCIFSLSKNQNVTSESHLYNYVILKLLSKKSIYIMYIVQLNWVKQALIKTVIKWLLCKVIYKAWFGTVI